MGDLLPCPFCGGAPKLKLGRGAWGVLCTCGGKAFIHTYDGGFVSTGKTSNEAKASAIAAWNRRAIPAADAGPCERSVYDRTGMPDVTVAPATDAQAEVLKEAAAVAHRAAVDDEADNPQYIANAILALINKEKP